MTTLREAAQQMLKCLEDYVKWSDPDCGEPTCNDCKAMRPVWEAIAAGKAALTQQEQAKQIGEGALILRHVDVELFDSLRRAQQEQDEPVLTINKLGTLIECSPTAAAFSMPDGEFSLFTTPPRREPLNEAVANELERLANQEPIKSNELAKARVLLAAAQIRGGDR